MAEQLQYVLITVWVKTTEHEVEESFDLDPRQHPNDSLPAVVQRMLEFLIKEFPEIQEGEKS